MSKSPAQLDREVQTALGLPPAVTKRVKAKMAAYKRAIAKVEEGYSDQGVLAAARARDAIDKAIYDATGHVPYVPGGKPHLAPPIVELVNQRDKLVSETWERAKERGRAANQRGHEAEIKRLREDERQASRQYDWMRK